MKVEINCSGCRRILRVPGNGKGKIICPHCSYPISIQNGKIVSLQSYQGAEIRTKKEPQNFRPKNINSNRDENATPFYIMGAVIIIFFYIFCSFISWTIELDEWSSFLRSIFFLGALGGIIIPIWLYHKD